LLRISWIDETNESLTEMEAESVIFPLMEMAIEMEIKIVSFTEMESNLKWN